MLTRGVAQLRRLPRFLRLVLGASATAIPFYFAAYLGNEVAQVGQFKTNAGLVHAAVLVVMLTVVVLIWRLIEGVFERAAEAEQTRRSALLHAYSLCDRATMNTIRTIHQGMAARPPLTFHLVSSRDCLQAIVDAAYGTFESFYGHVLPSGDRTDFEVTFMTKSYNDGEITIPASRNRDGRSPRSMVLRRADPTIYRRTVTAEIYGEPRPGARIISSTSGSQKYSALYSGQLNRIRSSIVFPVLSDQNELLGTLVVHCDKDGFFLTEDEKYWTDLLEVFAKPLALHKSKLDEIRKLATADPQGMGPLAAGADF